jgi:hypothetical protein
MSRQQEISLKYPLKCLFDVYNTHAPLLHRAHTFKRCQRRRHRECTGTNEPSRARCNRNTSHQRGASHGQGGTPRRCLVVGNHGPKACILELYPHTTRPHTTGTAQSVQDALLHYNFYCTYTVLREAYPYTRRHVQAPVESREQSPRVAPPKSQSPHRAGAPRPQERGDHTWRSQQRCQTPSKTQIKKHHLAPHASWVAVATFTDSTYSNTGCIWSRRVTCSSWVAIDASDVTAAT